MSPELEDVIAFVRDYAGWKSKVVNQNTLLERDLHLAGMDGVDFLEAAETFLPSALISKMKIFAHCLI